MKVCKGIFITAILFLFSLNSINAQSHWSLYLGLGTTWYYGDLNDRVLTHSDLFEFGGQIGVMYHFNDRFGARLNYLHGGVSGADSLAKSEAYQRRNLSFFSDVDEISLQLVLSPFGTIGRFTPYVFAGGGALNFKPKAVYLGEEIELQPLGTEGQFIADSGYGTPYDLWVVSIPLGIGVNFSLNDRWDIGIEAGYHKTFTDYLDDVSTVYPEMDKLAATPAGPLAVALSDRGEVPREAFSIRGNDASDGFGHVFLTLSYHFGRGDGNRSARGRGGVKDNGCYGL
ncbi:MAG: DUF6089 family protein [Bacteroidia bacterium]